MSVLPPAAANIFDLFKGFTLQALREPKLATAPTYQVFEYSRHNGAFVVWFHVESREFPHIIGYLPASACTVQEEVEAFRVAVRAHKDFFEISKSNLQADLLRTLYAVFDGEAEGILECRVPVARSDGSAAQESVEGTDEMLDDVPVSWRALALDILSGKPEHKGSQDGSVPDSYEVWAYRGDAASIVILRFFEGGEAWAAAACRAGIAQESASFELALDELYKLRLGGICGPTQLAELEAVFEHLRPAQAMSALGTALGIYLESGGIVYEPGIFGRATLETMSRIKLITSMESGGPSAQLSHFEVMASVLLDSTDPEDQVRWTLPREAQGLERIEVLKHRSYPGVLLVHFDPQAELILSACLPREGSGADADTHQAFELAVHHFVRNRKLLSDTPQPMPDISPFMRVKDSAIEKTLEEALDLLSDGKGIVKTFTTQDLRLGESTLQSATSGHTVIERPQGARLH